MPSNPAEAMAAVAAATPPVPIIPMKANWDAPENMRRLNTMVCHTLKPNATATAPKETP
jgi:hypothetical protein